MSEFEQLLADYYRDTWEIAEAMIKWCEPTKETIRKIKRMKKKSKKGLKIMKSPTARRSSL